MLSQRRSTLHDELKSTRVPQINRCSLSAAPVEKEEEEKPVELYMRVETASNGFKWFVIKKNAAALLSDEDKSLSICASCGAVANVTEPCFPPETNYQPYSSAVAVGDRFYVFGGMDVGVDSLQVSYIDTALSSSNNKGSWNLCLNKMPKGRDQPYPVTLNRNGIKSVLLVGALGLEPDDHPFAQMYYPLEDKWVVIENEPDQRPDSAIYGHALVQKGGQTIVVMHDYMSSKLFTYNVDTGSWGTLWDGEFGQHFHTGALVGRIYYVLNVFCRDSASLCGYDLDSEKATCLPVTFLEKKKKKKKKKNNKVEKECLPFFPNGYQSLPLAKLFFIGDSKISMVWQGCCGYMSSVHWSTFEMIEERTDAELKLFARPLSHVCYHVNNNWLEVIDFLPVLSPSSDGSKQDSVKKPAVKSSVDSTGSSRTKKVLDLSFNDFKGPGFEPLENCKALQQLYLAENQITSLASLPELPNLEFLSVAQNKLKSLSMASQPRLQVLAASKNKIATLKGFPLLPSLEHLRVEENPILQMPHLQAASILLVGPTLKKFNDRGDPKGLELAVPDCCENEIVIPKRTYFGGKEGDGEYTWYRTKKKFQASAVLKISDACEDVFICGNSETYTPSVEDVGAYLALSWLPTRADGKYGKPLISISSSPVSPALPVVSDVHVKMMSLADYVGEGEYFGGYEGQSLFSWYREAMNGSIILINGADSKSYQVTEEDYNCRLLFGYTPVRSDSVVGELKLSEPTDIILPELPKIEMLALTGKAVEGNVLTAVEVIPESETQHHVWRKYKKEVRYQWFSSSELENEMAFEPLPSLRSCSYKLRLEDIGRCLRCECIVSDVFGRSSNPAYAESSIVLPGIPRIDKLEIEGRGFHTNLYAVSGSYSGGKEGKSRIQWLRSMVGSPDLISILGETGRMYEANVDDVGYRLVAIYTPLREDGVEGQPVSASTDPIAVEPDILKEVKQKLDLGSVKFEALFDKDRTPKKTPVIGALERRSLEVNRKRIKVVKPGSKTSFPTTEIRGTYAPPFHVELFRNDQHRIKIVVDSENEIDLLVQTRHMRDVIVLVIRGLVRRFNRTSLNSLLKIET